MRRREFIALVGGASAYPLTVYSQQLRGMRRIGYLATTLRSDTMEEAFDRQEEGTACRDVCRCVDSSRGGCQERCVSRFL